MAITTAQVGTSSSIFSQAIDRYGQFRSHIARRNLAFINADIANKNAQLVEKKIINVKIENRITLDRARKEAEVETSKGRALIGKTGVQAEGSPQRAIEQLVQDQEFRALALEYSGTTRVSQLLAERDMFKLQEVFAKMEAKAEDTAAAMSDPNAYLMGSGGGLNFGRKTDPGVGGGSSEPIATVHG